MEEKKKKFPLVTIIIIIIGFALFLTGLVFYFVAGNSFGLGIGETETIERNFDAAEIEKLSFDLGVGKFTIKAGDTDKIEVLGTSVPKDRFEVETSGNEFSIKSTKTKWSENIYIPFGKKAAETEFEIVVPDKEYNKIYFKCGVGEVTLEGLDTENFELDGGVGAVDMTDCNIGKTDIDAGVGEIKFQGKLLGNMELDMGVGAATFDIDGYENDYKIKESGKVKIKSNESGSERTDKLKIDIDSGVGEVKFKFR